jgi:hypothetical protein
MLPIAAHRIVAAGSHAVPAPFLALAVRSDEAEHAWAARAPYGRVHVVGTTFLDAQARASLAAQGFSRVRIDDVFDVDYANISLEELAATVPRVSDLADRIAASLAITEVCGSNGAPYLRSLQTRVDYLATVGAGFHNDVARHWSRCLFWILALHVDDVEFVMPHAGVRLALAPGDLVVFDPAMAHGLCRPGDAGQAVAASFEDEGQDANDDGQDANDEVHAACGSRRQVFLTGELPLTDAQWELLDSPWLPVEVHEQRRALDLMVAEFDERTGAIKRVRTLQDGMKRSTCHVEPD